jgi:hypothetical protein
MQERIERFNKSGRRPLTTVVEPDQSANSKKRKREKDPIIIILTTLTGNTITKFESDDINRSDWFLDSGTTGHFSNDKTQFIELDKSFAELASIADSEKKLSIKSKEIVQIYLDLKHGTTILQVKDIYYSPTVRINFLSPSVIF